MPTGTDWRDWAAYGVQVLGWGEQSEHYRADTAQCLDDARKAGLIR